MKVSCHSKNARMWDNNMHVFTIPTNRELGKSIDSIYREIQYFTEATNQDSCLLVVDTSSEDVSQVNSVSVKSKFPDSLKSTTHIIHCTLKDQDNFIAKLSEVSKIPLSQLSHLLQINATDYGKVYNMIYLLSISLGGSVIHRRDSDCFVDSNVFPEMPIESELKFLGEPFSKNDGTISEPLCIVGSDYYGNWNLDIEEYFDRNQLSRYLEIYGVNPMYVDAYIQAKYQKNETFLTSPILVDSPYIRNYPECGNIAISRIHEYIPNFIGKQGIGYDYNSYNIASFVECPILYHPTKICHKHNEGRKTLDSQKCYWRGILKHIGYDEFITHYKLKCTQGIIGEKKGIEAIQSLSKGILASSLYETFRSHSSSNRNDQFRDIIDLLQESKHEFSKEISQYLNENINDINNELDDDFKISIQLQHLWPDLVSAAKDIFIHG